MHVKRKEHLFRRAVRLENRLKPLANVLNIEAEIPLFLRLVHTGCDPRNCLVNCVVVERNMFQVKFTLFRGGRRILP